MAQVQSARKVRQQVVFRPESVYGTDPMGGTYVDADVIRAVADSIRVSPNLEEFLNLATAGNLGRLPSAIGLRTVRLSFDQMIRGRGVAYDDSPLVVPEIDLALRACGLARTIDATPGSEFVGYQPSDTHEAMTVYVVQPIAGSATAVAAQLVGMHGTPTFRGVAGGPMRATFDLEGVLEEIADVTFVGGTMAATPQYPTLKSAAFQIGTGNYAPRIREVSFAMGNVLQRVPSINAASGLVGFQITDREPELVIDPEADLEANSAWWAALQDGDPLHDCTFQLGTAQYNRLKFRFSSDGSTAGLQVVGQEWVERDGITAFRMRLRPTIVNGANTDFALRFD